MDSKRAGLVAGLFLAALIGGGLITGDNDPQPQYSKPPAARSAAPTVAELSKRHPERVDMREFVQLSKNIAPALKRGAQCKSLDCSDRELTPACDSLAKMDEMAYDIESRIGEPAALAIADASTSCRMALDYMGKGDAASATVMVREMDRSLGRATRAMSGSESS